MFAPIHSFKSRALTFTEALNTHAMTRPAVQFYVDTRGIRGAAANIPELVELWDGLCARQDPAKCNTIMSECVELTMPPEYALVIRRTAGTATAFAFCELAKALAPVRDLTDDLDVRAAMIKGWRKFEERRQQANNVREGFGCDESQSWLTLRDVNDDLSRDPQIIEKISAIAALAGRMYEKFGYMRKDQPNDDPEESTGATLGGDIDRVLPTELAMLADEDTADITAMKILQDRAQILQMKGKESKNRGPMVLLIDESGSMHDSGHWQAGKKFAGRNTWAKAAAVALTRIAWQEDRAVVCVHFGTSCEVQAVPKDDYRAMFEMARAFLGGGTSFETAFRSGIEEVGDLEENGHAGADILIITDGVEHNHTAHTRMIDQMDQKGIKLWTVAIGVDIPATAPVRARAERYTFASDQNLSKPETATELAEGLNQAAMGNPPDYSVN